MAGFDNDVVFADNVDFSGGATVSGKVTADGELLIGSTASPNIGVSTLTAGTGITITNASSSITIDATGSTPLSFPTDSGTATPAANALTIAGSTMLNTSGAGSTVTVNLDSTLMIQGNNCFFWNLSFTHAGGTLTLAGADGTALSSTNPGYVVMPSNATEGRLVLHTITANDTLTMSDMTGNTFGTTASVAWGNSMPWWVGFMADSSDANLEPVVARLPNIQTSPSASANIGDPSAANADEEYSVFAWNDITEGNYQDMQIGFIGSLTVTKDASDDWTLDALTARDGAARFNDNRVFNMPAGQNGAASGTFNISTAGTDPVYTGQSVGYQIARDGLVTCSISLQNCSTPGTGANAYQPVLPYTNFDMGQVDHVGSFTDNSAGGIIGICRYVIGTGDSFVQSVLVTGNSVIFDVEDVDSGDSFSCVVVFYPQSST